MVKQHFFKTIYSKIPDEKEDVEDLSIFELSLVYFLCFSYTINWPCEHQYLYKVWFTWFHVAALINNQTVIIFLRIMHVLGTICALQVCTETWNYYFNITLIQMWHLFSQLTMKKHQCNHYEITQMQTHYQTSCWGLMEVLIIECIWGVINAKHFRCDKKPLGLSIKSTLFQC